jgi:hypothetical protein
MFAVWPTSALYESWLSCGQSHLRNGTPDKGFRKSKEFSERGHTQIGDKVGEFDVAEGTTSGGTFQPLHCTRRANMGLSV